MGWAWTPADPAFAFADCCPAVVNHIPHILARCTLGLLLKGGGQEIFQTPSMSDKVLFQRAPRRMDITVPSVGPVGLLHDRLGLNSFELKNDIIVSFFAVTKSCSAAFKLAARAKDLLFIMPGLWSWASFDGTLSYKSGPGSWEGSLAGTLFFRWPKFTLNVSFIFCCGHVSGRLT